MSIRREEGYSLLEVTVGMLILLAAVTATLPSLTKNITTGRILWERRLAMRVIDSELEWACNYVAMPPMHGAINDPPIGANPVLATDFDELDTGATGVLNTSLPSELINSTGDRTVECLNGATLLPLGPPVINGDGSCPTDPTTGNPSALKRVLVSVSWSSAQNRNLTEQSTDYIISRSGVCTGG